MAISSSMAATTAALPRDVETARNSLEQRGFLLAPTTWPEDVAHSLDELPAGVLAGKTRHAPSK
eukprot:SAG11_NODE_6832_length_1238_cov_1.771730_2_plen_64_part_00